ncbi:hypothetical protein CHUAL_000675 [Chamberlinius hualienensis]
MLLAKSSLSCKVIESGVTDDDIAVIVNRHNQLRNQVATGQIANQPSASNMNEIAWDSNLAKLAQDWADKCQYGHNKPKDKDFKDVGQNIAQLQANYDIVKNFTSPIDAWFDEVYKPGYPPDGYSTQYTKAVPLVFTDATGHYTQIVWANTSYIGCGFVKYDPQNPPYTQALYYVCNYGPAGNYIGLDIYKIGKPASDCPDKKSASKNYSGLCS